MKVLVRTLTVTASDDVLVGLSTTKTNIPPSSGILTGTINLLVYHNSGMRTIKTLSNLRSDWLMGKWSVLIGREQRSRD